MLDVSVGDDAPALHLNVSQDVFLERNVVLDVSLGDDAPALHLNVSQDVFLKSNIVLDVSLGYDAPALRDCHWSIRNDFQASFGSHSNQDRVLIF